MKRLFKRYKPFYNLPTGFYESEAERHDWAEIECGNCDEYLNEDMVYCPKCGYKINWNDFL